MMLSAAIYSGSSSLLSGGLDNLGDALTYVLSLAVIGASGRAKARVALLKGALILGAAVAVAIQIGWRLAHPNVPIFEAIGIAAVINLAFNGICLRSEAHTSELQSLMRISYAVFCLKKNTTILTTTHTTPTSHNNIHHH